MPATELAFGIFLVAGALPLFLDLDLVVWELGNILRAGRGHFASRQRTYPRSSGLGAAGIRLNALIVT